MNARRTAITDELIDEYIYFVSENDIADSGELDMPSMEMDLLQDLSITDSMQFSPAGAIEEPIPLRYDRQKPWCCR